MATIKEGTSMQHTITCTETLSAPVEQVWAVWSDVESYPTWDEREELNRLDGAFAVGTTGTFKQRSRGKGTYRITAVEQGTAWTTEVPLPLGKLVIEHELECVPEGTHVIKRYTAHGPMALAFKWFFASGINREMPGSFAALRAEIARRSSGAVG